MLPASSVAEEQAAAFRKLLLVDVLARGPAATGELPAAAAPILAAAGEAAAPFRELAAAVAAGMAPTALRALLDAQAIPLAKEAPLVAAVVAHAPRARLQRLSAVYDRLPLGGSRGAAARAQVPEADAAVLLAAMASDGSLRVRLTADAAAPGGSLVSFDAALTPPTESSTVAALESQLAAVVAAAARLHRADEAFALTPQLQALAAKAKRSGSSGGGSFGGMMLGAMGAQVMANGAVSALADFSAGDYEMDTDDDALPGNAGAAMHPSQMVTSPARTSGAVRGSSGV